MGADQSHSTQLPNLSVGSVGLTRNYYDIPLWALLVLEYSSWSTRGTVAQLNRQWHTNTQDIHYYRFLCQRIAIEHGLYVSYQPPANETWRTLFFDLWKLRQLWSPRLDLTVQSDQTFQERFKISVFAKFRPLAQQRQPHKVSNPKNKKNWKQIEAKEQNKENDENQQHQEEKDKEEDEEEASVTLPLHQRLAMIRMSHNITNNRSALKVLTEEGGWFQAKWSAALAKRSTSSTRQGEAFTAGDDENTYQPRWMSMNIKDQKKCLALDAQQKMIAKVHSIDPLSGRVVMITPDVGLREFSFDAVLPEKVSQQRCYDVSTKRLVMDMLNGFNATSIVFGQTGSGKTYSMFGNDEAAIYGQNKDGKGIVPRACEEIFHGMKVKKEQSNIESTLSVAYVEIYGDQVSDLLKFGARCGQSKVASQRFVLNGAAERVVHSMEDIYEALRVGEAQKRRAATAMNDRSTRAHSLFILTLKQSKPDSQVTLQSRLFLADLGGSEQVKKSQVEAGALRTAGVNDEFSLGFQMATHMREAVYINMGLLALKKCIEALNTRSYYVPFQDSKLTMLLSEGIGGNSKTSIIVCANMDPSQSAETIASLRFGEKCALIENSARNNATILAGILADLDARIKALEATILAKERWELREEKREDQLAEEGTIEKALGGHEIRTIAMVVGAEEERKQLATLLAERAQFVGTMDDDEVKELDQDGVDVKKASVATKKVIGFGKKYAEIYGFGGQFDETEEQDAENERFQAKTNEESVPLAVRLKKGKKGWATGETYEEDKDKLAVKAKKIKRNKLAYSGISFG